MTAPIRKHRLEASSRRRAQKQNGAHTALARAEEFARILARLGPLDPVDAPSGAAASATEGDLYKEPPAQPVPAPLAQPPRPRAPRDLIYLTRPRSAEAERIRALRARLFTTAADKIDCFSVAGVGSRARIAYLGANLAASFALAGRKTLLVDADFRRPRLTRFFGIEAEKGLSDVVAGDVSLDDALIESGVDRLSLLPAGRADAEEQFNLAGLSPVMAAAQAAFDHVIVLTGPVGVGAHAHFVWAATGRVVLVARRAEARATETRHVAKTMRQLDAEILGAVLTD